MTNCAEIKEGPQGPLFVNLFVEERYFKREYIDTYNLIKGCQTEDEIGEVLCSNGFTQLRKGGDRSRYYFNCSNILIDTWQFTGGDGLITVNLKYSDADSPESLQKMWNFFTTVSKMTPLEMQA